MSKLPRITAYLHAACLACLIVSLGGCGATKTSGDVYVNTGPLPKPTRVLVHEFAFKLDQVRPNQAIGARVAGAAEGETLSEKEEKLGQEVAKVLADELVRRLNAIGLPAELAAGPEDGAEAEGTVAIEGQFLKIDQGNRLRRMVIGLGVGNSKVNTQVQVYEDSAAGRVRVTEFATTARSIFKPGMAETGLVGVAAGAAVATAAEASGGAAAGAELAETAQGDARRTAKLITKHLANLAYQHGWITREQALKAHAEAARDDDEDD